MGSPPPDSGAPTPSRTHSALRQLYLRAAVAAAVIVAVPLVGSLIRQEEYANRMGLTAQLERLTVVRIAAERLKFAMEGYQQATADGLASPEDMHRALSVLRTGGRDAAAAPLAPLLEGITGGVLGLSASDPLVRTKVGAVVAIIDSLSQTTDSLRRETSRQAQTRTDEDHARQTLVSVVMSLLTLVLVAALLRGTIRGLRRAIEVAERRGTQLYQSEQRLSTIFNSLTDGVVLHRPDGIIVEANPAAERILGLSRDQLLGRHSSDPRWNLIDPDETDLTESPAITSIRTGESQRDVPVGVRQPDGTRRWLSVNTDPIHGPGGTIEAVVASFVDITERREAETALAQSQRLLAQVVDVLPQRVFWKDAEGRYLGANKAFRQDAGVHDLIGKNDYDMPWAGPEADFYRATDRRIMETRQTEVDIVEPQTRPDGSNAWLTTSKVPLTSVDGQVIGILGTYMDITERVRNEEQLKWANRLGEAVRSVQARFIAADNPRMAFEAILDDIIALTESEFGFIAEVLNDENGSPYQRTYAISNIAWNDETRAHYAEFRDVGLEFRNPNTLLGQVVTTAEAVVANAPASDPRRGGMPFGHPEINAFLGLPLRIGPELVGTIGLANRSGGYSEDLPSQLEPLTTAMARMIRSWQSDTARREAESELQEKKAELEYLFDSSLDLIIVGSADGRARRINQAWTATLGYQPADLVDTPMLDLVHPEDRAEAASRLEMVTGRATVIEAFPIRLRHKDGSYRWVEWRGVPAAEGAFFGTGRDVTDRKRDEAELVAARQRAEAATHAKSMFLATMSHEIRTPMNGVLGMTSLLRDTALTTEQQDYVDTIHRSGESLLAIINDILDFSKIEAGRVELDIAPFETGTLGHDVRSLLGAAAAAKGLELRIEIDEAVPQWARADGGRIRQVLLNLTGNAIKFTTRGAVTVRLVIASSDRGPLLRCEVRDTGIGMTRDAIDRLFVPFTQGDPGMSRRFGGTGLGLAISKRLVELMGGAIGATSVPGEGSTFWFTALITPVAEPAYRPAGATTTEPLTPLPDLRVLLAEDNVVNQKVAGKILQKLGCRVEIAANGREAIDMHRREPYDLILMDWQMPELDGVEATRAIRADTTLRQVPIIAMTANAMRGDREECLRAGMDDYLAKPIDAGRLRETLARWARRPTIGGTQGISARSCFLTRNKPS